jgi:SAM-dependent methyltransferase/uncharacterized protein YbaR (Trm112 family)
MRYSLLDLLASPDTGAPFVLVGATEAGVPYSGPYGKPGSRVSHPGAQVGPAPEGEAGAFYTQHLEQYASAPDDPDRNYRTIVVDGLLVATDTGMWYPIVDTIPEILPSSLRDWGSHHAFLDQVIAPRISPKLVEALRGAIGSVDTGARKGDSYKSSEIALLGKVEDKANFLAPGLLSPFNPHVYNHPADLIRGFANCLPFLQLQHGQCVLDSGSGYGWTTEWLMKLGIDAVGIDISRMYPDVGRQRMGPNNQPHLVVGDAENLPFAAGVFDAVLGFDAFHHIPNRPAAMRQYARVLKANGRVVLLEPGEDHEAAEVSQQVMDNYGIMEVGMTLADVQGYIDGIESFGPARQIFLRPHFSDDPRESVPAAELRDRSYIGWCQYLIEKDTKGRSRPEPKPLATSAFKLRTTAGLGRLMDRVRNRT